MSASSDASARDKLERFLDKEYPLHALVTGIQLTVRTEPHPEAQRLGWLRIGARVRLKRDNRKTATCRSGWYSVYPKGWACAGEGLEIGKSPPKRSFALNPPPQDAALPYEYYMVKENAVPEYHRLPSRNEQRAALKFAKRYLELREKKPKRAHKLVAEGIPGEPERPAVLRRLIDRGFFVAGAGVEVRARRRFVRTVSGRYIKQAQLVEQVPAEFRGIRLEGEQTLPVAWAVRGATPLEKITKHDGSVVVREVKDHAGIARHSRLQWLGHENIAGRLYHKLADGYYLRDWFAGVAKKIEPPSEVEADETWIHIDVGEQTLVLYRGKKPLYATLVSTGISEHDTPLGGFRIRDKRVADTMANIGPEADERYSIEDVPWTQYLKGSIAIHGAFWHTRFGLKRSHGCINLAPFDAHVVFNETEPHVPDGWHGINVRTFAERGSYVYITP